MALPPLPPPLTLFPAVLIQVLVQLLFQAGPLVNAVLGVLLVTTLVRVSVEVRICRHDGNGHTA